MNIHDKNLTRFLSQAPLFKGLSFASLQAINCDLVKRKYQGGKIIFREGELGQFLYIIRTGQVRIFINNAEGHELTVALFSHPGQIFGHISLIDDFPRSATAVTLCPTTLYALNRANFHKHIAQQSPQLALNLLKMFCTYTRTNNRQMTTLASLDIPQKLACTLIDLAEKHGQSKTRGIQINLSLTQRDLASFIGATRESVNKNLREWHIQEWIQIKSKRITILDVEALHRKGHRAIV